MMDLELTRHGRAPPDRFQVLGERSSGTNYLKALIASNLPLLPDKGYGWKHAPPVATAYAPGLLLVVVFREAIDWLRSMYAKPWHATATVRARGFPAFLREPWLSEVDGPGHFGLPRGDPRLGQPLQLDRHPITGRPYANPIEMRNVKSAAFLGLANRKVDVAFTRLEWVQQDPPGFLARLAGGFDLPMASPPVLPDRHFGYARKWRAERPVTVPPRPLEPEDMAHVLSELDLAQEARLGYRYT